jgi:hypothetical protein
MRARLAGLGLLALLAAAGPARAGDEAPRTTVVIGGVSIVLIAADGKLLAFIDRLADNAPLGDAELVVAPDGGPPLPLAKAADGLLVAPFDRGRRSRDSFRVELRSPEGSGQRAAELVYDTLPPRPEASPRPGLASMLGVAVLSSGVGAAVALLATLSYRILRRRPAAARPAAGRVGTA